jgi:MFS family permease
MVFGRLGDRRGRRFVLVSTLLLMGISTLLMGLLPTYATAGIASPIVLVVLRFIQGTALGGEWAGAVLLSLEHGAPEHRGRNASWAQMGPALGTLLATGLIAGLSVILSAEGFQSWGWRVPFLASAVLVGFGLWIRSGVEETPLFVGLRRHGSLADSPIREVLGRYWRRLLIAGGARIGPDVLYSLLIVFTLSYLTTVLRQSRTLALTAVCAGAICNAAAVPMFGALSDRYGRRPVYACGVLLAIAWAFLYFKLLDGVDPAHILMAVAGGFIIHAVMYGPQAAFITEQFPTRVRYAGSSLAYTLVGIVGGGLAPVLFAILLRAYGTAAMSLYLTVTLLLTLTALAVARETNRLPLE